MSKDSRKTIYGLIEELTKKPIDEAFTFLSERPSEDIGKNSSPEKLLEDIGKNIVFCGVFRHCLTECRKLLFNFKNNPSPWPENYKDKRHLIGQYLDALHNAIMHIHGIPLGSRVGSITTLSWIARTDALEKNLGEAELDARFETIQTIGIRAKIESDSVRLCKQKYYRFLTTPDTKNVIDQIREEESSIQKAPSPSCSTALEPLFPVSPANEITDSTVKPGLPKQYGKE